VRLFIGVPLPAPAQTEVAAILRRLRAREWPVRWVRDKGIHLTIKFFGETTSDRVDAIVEMLNFATEGLHPLTMVLSTGGVSPSVRQPRVIYLGIDPEPSLELLQDRVERGGERLGFPPEGRPFRPHLTLGRVREGHRLPQGWQAELERIPAGEAFVADRVVLFESELTPAGPTYTVRHEVVLK
jgi:2'-5' RNA ligase